MEWTWITTKWTHTHQCSQSISTVFVSFHGLPYDLIFLGSPPTWIRINPLFVLIMPFFRRFSHSIRFRSWSFLASLFLLSLFSYLVSINLRPGKHLLTQTYLLSIQKWRISSPSLFCNSILDLHGNSSSSSINTPSYLRSYIHISLKRSSMTTQTTT